MPLPFLCRCERCVVIAISSKSESMSGALVTRGDCLVYQIKCCKTRGADSTKARLAPRVECTARSKGNANGKDVESLNRGASGLNQQIFQGLGGMFCGAISRKLAHIHELIDISDQCGIKQQQKTRTCEDKFKRRGRNRHANDPLINASYCASGSVVESFRR